MEHPPKYIKHAIEWIIRNLETQSYYIGREIAENQRVIEILEKRYLKVKAKQEHPNGGEA